MWNDSLIMYSADNGGTDLGCNWPLRGSKHSKLITLLQEVCAIVFDGLVDAVFISELGRWNACRSLSEWRICSQIRSGNKQFSTYYRNRIANPFVLLV